MAIEETRVRLNHLRISEVSTKAILITTEKEQSTEEVVPTRIEEAGRKYCCAKCYRSCGRVTHVALEWRVTLEPISVVSGGKGREHQPYYTCRFPAINSHRVEAGILDHSVFIRKFNTVCNFCGEVVGWHLTTKSDSMPDNAVYKCDTLMDRAKVVLLDEEENEIPRDCYVDSELPSINYMKERKAEKVLPLGIGFKRRQRQRQFLGTEQLLAQGRTFNRPRQVLSQVTAIKPAPRQVLAQGTAIKPAPRQVLAQGTAIKPAPRQVLALATAIKPAPRNLKWDYFA